MIVAGDANLEIQRLELGPFGTNAYIAVCRRTRDSVLIDAPAEPGAIVSGLKGTNPRYILLTHSHMDHVGALAELRTRLKVPLAAHASDAGNLSSPPEMSLNHGDSVSFGDLKFEVLHTPGHTPGSLCFKTGRYLISGDTIFPGGPGKTGSPADFRQIVESIAGRILVLPDDTQIYPGHGASTVLGKEKEAFAAFSARSRDPNLCGDVFWLSH